MIEFITRHADDISFWLMFAIAICSNILLHCQKKAYRRLVHMQTETLKDLLQTETEYNKVICVVTEFIDSHNFWHDRKIKLYYNQDSWHCCYADEMPQGNMVTDQEEITQQNEKRR